MLIIRLIDKLHQYIYEINSLELALREDLLHDLKIIYNS